MNSIRIQIFRPLSRGKLIDNAKVLRLGSNRVTAWYKSHSMDCSGAHLCHLVEEGVWVQAHAGMDRMDEIRVLQLEEMAQSPKLS